MPWNKIITLLLVTCFVTASAKDSLEDEEINFFEFHDVIKLFQPVDTKDPSGICVMFSEGEDSYFPSLYDYFCKDTEEAVELTEESGYLTEEGIVKSPGMWKSAKNSFSNLANRAVDITAHMSSLLGSVSPGQFWKSLLSFNIPHSLSKISDENYAIGKQVFHWLKTAVVIATLVKMMHSIYNKFKTISQLKEQKQLPILGFQKVDSEWWETLIRNLDERKENLKQKLDEMRANLSNSASASVQSKLEEAKANFFRISDLMSSFEKQVEVRGSDADKSYSDLLAELHCIQEAFKTTYRSIREVSYAICMNDSMFTEGEKSENCCVAYDTMKKDISSVNEDIESVSLEIDSYVSDIQERESLADASVVGSMKSDKTMTNTSSVDSTQSEKSLLSNKSSKSSVKSRNKTKKHSQAREKTIFEDGASETTKSDSFTKFESENELFQDFTTLTSDSMMQSHQTSSVNISVNHCSSSTDLDMVYDKYKYLQFEQATTGKKLYRFLRNVMYRNALSTELDRIKKLVDKNLEKVKVSYRPNWKNASKDLSLTKINENTDKLAMKSFGVHNKTKDVSNEELLSIANCLTLAPETLAKNLGKLRHTERNVHEIPLVANSSDRGVNFDLALAPSLDDQKSRVEKCLAEIENQISNHRNSIGAGSRNIVGQNGSVIEQCSNHSIQADYDTDQFQRFSSNSLRAKDLNVDNFFSDDTRSNIMESSTEEQVEHCKYTSSDDNALSPLSYFKDEFADISRIANAVMTPLSFFKKLDWYRSEERNVKNDCNDSSVDHNSFTSFHKASRSITKPNRSLPELDLSNIDRFFPRFDKSETGSYSQKLAQIETSSNHCMSSLNTDVSKYRTNSSASTHNDDRLMAFERELKEKQDILKKLQEIENGNIQYSGDLYFKPACNVEDASDRIRESVQQKNYNDDAEPEQIPVVRRNSMLNDVREFLASKVRSYPFMDLLTNSITGNCRDSTEKPVKECRAYSLRNEYEFLKSACEVEAKKNEENLRKLQAIKEELQEKESSILYSTIHTPSGRNVLPQLITQCDSNVLKSLVENSATAQKQALGIPVNKSFDFKEPSTRLAAEYKEDDGARTRSDEQLTSRLRNITTAPTRRAASGSKEGDSTLSRRHVSNAVPRRNSGGIQRLNPTDSNYSRQSGSYYTCKNYVSRPEITDEQKIDNSYTPRNPDNDVKPYFKFNSNELQQYKTKLWHARKNNRRPMVIKNINYSSPHSSRLRRISKTEVPFNRTPSRSSSKHSNSGFNDPRERVLEQKQTSSHNQLEIGKSDSTKHHSEAKHSSSSLLKSTLKKVGSNSSRTSTTVEDTGYSRQIIQNDFNYYNSARYAEFESECSDGQPSRYNPSTTAPESLQSEKCSDNSRGIQQGYPITKPTSATRSTDSDNLELMYRVNLEGEDLRREFAKPVLSGTSSRHSKSLSTHSSRKLLTNGGEVSVDQRTSSRTFPHSKLSSQHKHVSKKSSTSSNGSSALRQQFRTASDTFVARRRSQSLKIVDDIIKFKNPQSDKPNSYFLRQKGLHSFEEMIGVATNLRGKQASNNTVSTSPLQSSSSKSSSQITSTPQWKKDRL